MATDEDNPLDEDRSRIGHNWLTAMAAEIRALQQRDTAHDRIACRHGRLRRP